MKAWLYARYSDKKQSPASIEDQFRICERIAERNGFQIVGKHFDRAITGGTRQRPGYQEMLRAARAKRFDVLVAEDTSRLWRNLAEQAPRLAELSDLGIEVVTLDLDTRVESAGMLSAVLGASAEAYRKEIARRTRRGLEGRAKLGKSCGGRAYGYIAAKDSESGEPEIHAEQANIVREIFQWYADGKSPRWIATELNRLNVPSPGASWNRTSDRLNAKRKRGWVPTAVHGDRRRGTGILNNPAYIGEKIWNRSMWKRSAADSLERRWQLNDPKLLIRHRDERLRIVSQELWDAVKRRQDDTAAMTIKLRGALKKNGRLPRYLLSGLLRCEECGGGFRCVNGREYGCASHRDGGDASCKNGIRLPIKLAEKKLLSELAEEILSPAGVTLLEQRIREHLRDAAQAPSRQAEDQPAEVRKKLDELAQLRALMKAGTLSLAVAQVAIEKAEEELQGLQRTRPESGAKEAERIIRMLPRGAEKLRQRIRAGNLGLRNPSSIVEGRNILFGMFGGKVPLKPAQVKDGERPYLIARVGINREILLEAAAEAAGCVKNGSGGRI